MSLILENQSGRSAKSTIYTASVVVIVVAAFVIRAPTLWISSIDWDEGLYIVMVQQWLSGHLPFVAIWDQHPPGLPALLTVTQLMFVDPVLGARLAATLAAVTTALLIHRFSAVYFNRAGAGLIAALLYIICISRWLGLAANTEIFNNAIVTAAAYLLCGAALRPSTSLPPAISAALLLGIGIQIKYNIVADEVFLCFAYLLALYRQHHNFAATAIRTLLLVLAGCLPTLIVLVYFWTHGALPSFISANLRSNIAYLQMVPTLSAIAQSSGSGIAPTIGCITILAYTVIRQRQYGALTFVSSTPHAWLALWFMADAANVCLPLKFFNHYYFALYPSVCLAGALALSKIARGRFVVFAIGVMILFATALPYLLVAEARVARGTKFDVERAIAEVLCRAGARDMSVFVYDYSPVIYALAHVRPPTRYVLGSELNQYSYSAGVDGITEVKRIMDNTPDFVVQRQRLPNEVGWAALDGLVARRLAAYHVVYQAVDSEDGATVRVYRR